MVRVLVVDDSGFFRRRIVEILDADDHITVVGTAANGREAIQKVMELKPDVVTMDIEMPVMDGITAVKRIMKLQPTPVLMFSSLSYEGAQATLDALDAGALDFLPKRFDEFSQDREEAKRILRARVRQIGARGLGPKPTVTTTATGTRTATPAAASARRPVAAARRGDFRLVTIGSSTGGPVALQQVLTQLPATFPLPILLIQHMPSTFTPAFAQRLNQQCQIRVKEAEDGEMIEKGTAYLAPGGRQMGLVDRGGKVLVRIYDGDASLHYKPSVDLAFASAAEVFPGKVLSIVMTGMGADGREGARALKKGGATVWAQDEATCVIFGMPGAVVEANLADQVLPLGDIGRELAKSV
ncbi:MAG: chemotaxis response regulator protein-glutamate methylesterase [Gammaproteobacteria bacterium]|nr:chemotaxis response regulator protein-glutamate methylesterase [Gammaproteobacteria bacterium]